MEQTTEIYIFFIKGLSAYGQTAFQKGCSVEGTAKDGRVMTVVGPLRWTKEAQAAAGSDGGPSSPQPPVLLGSQALAMLHVKDVKLRPDVLQARLPSCP